jgi:hypothetical protein
MPGQYPVDGSVRLHRGCGSGQAEPESGRLFLCAGCRSQVIICSCCDRGQIYCNRGCASRARHQTLRSAGRRYAKSLRGRQMHAARMGRYRARREIVTHHGSPPTPADDLLAWDALTSTRDEASPACGPRPSVPHCHWCGRGCLPLLRQGFLRRRRRHRGRVGQHRRGGTHHGDIG